MSRIGGVSGKHYYLVGRAALPKIFIGGIGMLIWVIDPVF
jgi:hypothetical protein